MFNNVSTSEARMQFTLFVFLLLNSITSCLFHLSLLPVHACACMPLSRRFKTLEIPCERWTSLRNSRAASPPPPNGSPPMATNVGDAPGEPTPITTSLWESATGAFQSFAPISCIHQHLCAFHFYAHDMNRQVEAHHFCAHLNEDVRQCLIFDSPDAGARLIGVEYIVSEPIFLTLADEEKPLWHSHEYEVKSGVLFLPGVPGLVERRDLEKVAKTYGKTIHFWQVDRGDKLPFGIPNLMMALTRDGQLREDLARDVEKKFSVSFEKARESLAYISGPEHGIHPLANGGGKGLMFELREVDLTSVARVFV